MTPRPHIVPDTPAELLINYQTALYHYHRARRTGSEQGIKAFGREVRRFEAAIGALSDHA